MDEDFIYIVLSHDDAKKLARLFRMVGTEHPDSDLAEPFDQLAISLGSHMRISTATDEQDELDENLVQGEEVSWQIFDSFNLSDNASPTEDSLTF